MAFGQPSGPPATAKELRTLQELLERAGHRDFRDARGPLGLTQRQAAGKFTRAEAAELIERLTAELDGADGAPQTAPGGSSDVPRGRPAERRSRSEQLLRAVPTEMLAAELQRRGWVVLQP
jgi:hypothetical protein